MEGIIDKLSREYTCDNCGAVKDNYYPWEKRGKKYCSLDCMNGKGLEKQIWKLEDNLKGLGKPVDVLLKELLNWVKKNGIVKISLNSNNNQLVVEFSDQRTKTLSDNELNLAQKGLQKFFQSGTKKAFSQRELEEVVNGKTNKGKVAKIGAAIIFGILLVAAIGIIMHKRKKKDH